MKRETKQDKLERKRKVFFLIGLIVSLSAVLMAFEWKSYDHSLKHYDRFGFDLVDEDLPILTKHEMPKLPPPITPVSVIKEVGNDRTDIIDVFIDTEVNPYEAIPEFIYTPPEEIIDDPSDEIFRMSQTMPSFPGGEKALLLYLMKNIKYTQFAREANITGTVYISFIIEKDGSIGSPKIVREIGGGLDEIALKVVSTMPKWKPGRQGGIPVRVSMVVPVSFKLQ